MTSLLRVVGLCATAVVLLASCSSGRSSVAGATPGEAIAAPPAELVPSQLVGLAVAPEDVSGALAETTRASVDQLGLYSLRSGSTLMATLQVSRTNDGRPDRIERYREAVLNQLGSSKPREAYVGSQPVYLTAGTKQRLAAWFKGRYMFVLATREEFPQRRALLRQAVGIEP